jgi:hypothetical protein
VDTRRQGAMAKKSPERGRYMTTRGGLVRTVLYLPESLKEELREFAHQERRSESDVLREALREYMDRLREER